MTVSLLATKLYIPRSRPGNVPRPDLVKRLNRGLDRKLTLISASAGFGKTTLLSEWSDGCKRPVAWVTLDDGDNDPTRFWIHVIAALERLQPGFGETNLAEMRSSQPSPVQVLLSGLINEISANFSPFVLVLDDYHLIEVTTIHGALSYFIDRMPAQMHLVVATRSDPPLSISGLRGRGELSEIRTVDLRFTPAETEAFINGSMDLDLHKEDLEIISRRTEGWAVGLQLAALSMQGRVDRHDFVANMAGDNRYIADYLLDEVLQQQTTPVQDFLLKTSLLDHLNGSLCQAVTGYDDCYQMLLELEQSNLFIVPLDDKREWFRYHHLFADLLRVQLIQSHPAVIPVLNRRASHWFEDHGLPREAVKHALSTGDFKRAVTLIEGNAINLVSHGEVETVVAWLDRLPAGYFQSHPWLSVARTWTLVSAGQLEAADVQLKVAEGILSELPNNPRVVGHIAAIRASIAGLSGDQNGIRRFSRLALENLPDDDFMARGLASIMRGLALRWGEDLPAAVSAYSEAEQIGRKGGDSFISIFASCYKGYVLVLCGQLQAAEATLRSALRYAERSARKGGWTPPVSGLARSFLSGVLLEWYQLDAAMAYASTGLDLSEKWGHKHAILDSYFFYISGLLASREFSKAWEAIQRAKKAAAGLSSMSMFHSDVAKLEIELLLAEGDADRAVQRIEGIGIREDDPVSFNLSSYHLTLAKALWMKDDLEPAVVLLERLSEVVGQAGALGRLIEVLVMKALVLYHLGHQAQALSAIGEALDMAEPEGFVWTFIQYGESMRVLLRTAAVQGMHVEYVSRLLPVLEEQIKLMEKRAISPASYLVEPLSERELQVLRLLVAGLSSTEIARELVIAVGTARTHIKNIYGKLNVHRRLEAIQRAKELNLV